MEKTSIVFNRVLLSECVYELGRSYIGEWVNVALVSIKEPSL